MRLIAVVGSASGSGKTRLACAILRAIPGLGAVKISPREGAPQVEWGVGAARKDTARFAASGAAKVARIIAPRHRVAEVWDGMCGAFAELPGVVVEGAGALDCAAARFTVFVADPQSVGERPERDERLAAAADCVVMVRSRREHAMELPQVIRGNHRRIPVFSVAADEEDWGDKTLLAAVRRFLASAHHAAQPAGDSTPQQPEE